MAKISLICEQCGGNIILDDSLKLEPVKTVLPSLLLSRIKSYKRLHRILPNTFMGIKEKMWKNY